MGRMITMFCVCSLLVGCAPTVVSIPATGQRSLGDGTSDHDAVSNCYPGGADFQNTFCRDGIGRGWSYVGWA